jgi:hypothetical protein
MNDNPYLVVGSPDYSTPVLNMFGDQKPQQKPQQKPGQQQQQTDQQLPYQPQQPNLYQILMKLFGGGQAPQQGPMSLGPDQTSAGNAGGTAGVLPGIY